MSSVIVYTLPNCVQCDTTKRMLDKNNIKYDSVDLSSDREAYDMVTKMGYQSAPVIFAGKDHWSGFRIDKIHSLVANKTQQ